MASREEEKERLREHRLEAEQAAGTKTKRDRMIQIGLAGVLGALVIGALLLALLGGSGSSTSTAQAGDFGQHYEGLQERRLAAGIPTMSEPGSGEHFHPILAVYARGKKITIPVNIGIDPNLPPSEMVGLHTHDELGTIHVENATDPTLGQFFEVWGVPFSRKGLGPYRADGEDVVRMWVDGKPSQAFGALKLADGQQIVVSFDARNAAPPPPKP
jgi:hypothetical protein